MTSKPINLRQYRKRKQREDKARTAEANRIAHGTPKVISDLAKARQELAKKQIEAHRRADTPPSEDGDDQ
ncbi:MAG: DUF4169 domain-containing protein [Maricaulis sp.]|nr:DUF4169 domain-containing protein [Maricaulis sp.]